MEGEVMTFDDVLAHILALLQRQGRVSYGALKRRFHLDDVYLDDLKAELIDARRLAVDEHGRVLVWVGTAEALAAPAAVPPAGQNAPPSLAAEVERRHLTVLFCDLVDAAALAGQLETLHREIYGSSGLLTALPPRWRTCV
jgi:hypothetical protein